MYKKILVSVDLNDANSWEKGLPAALSLARADSAEICLFTVVPDYGMSVVGSYFPEGAEKKAMEGAKTRLTEIISDHVPDDVPHSAVVGHGRVYDQILKAAGQTGADLIVIVSHSPDLKDYLLGPNAARVARHAKQSVLIVR